VQKIVGNARVSFEYVCKKCITELIITQKSSCCLFTCKTAFDFIHTVQVDSGHIILQCYKLHSLPYILLSVFVRCWLGGSKGFWRISNLFIVIASLGHGLHYPGKLSVPSVAWRNECQLSDSVMTDGDVDGSSLPLPLQLPCEIWMAMQRVERPRDATPIGKLMAQVHVFWPEGWSPSHSGPECVLEPKCETGITQTLELKKSPDTCSTARRHHSNEMFSFIHSLTKCVSSSSHTTGAEKIITYLAQVKRHTILMSYHAWYIHNIKTISSK